MPKYFLITFALLVVPVAAYGVAPTVVLPTPPFDGASSPLTTVTITIPLALLGIDPATVTVAGALRGEVYRDGGEIFYVPDPARFLLTDFDLLRVRTPGGQTVLNVAVVRAESDVPKELVSRAGDAAVAGPGWSLDGAAAWDPSSGAYVVEGRGEIEFDFLRDDVTDQTLGTASHGAQSGSGSSMTLRPPPPDAPLGLPSSTLVYQGGGGDEVWELWLRPNGEGHQLEVALKPAAGDALRTFVPVPEGPEVGIELGSFGGTVALTLSTPGSTTDHHVVAPLGFSMDRTWHRFGNLANRGYGTMEVDDLRVARTSADLARQVVVVDDFDGPEWDGVWISPGAGALKLGPSNDLGSGRDGGGVLVASLDQAALFGPAYLARSLEVPRVAMTCRFDLDLSSLSGESVAGSATVLAFRDESQAEPLARDRARLLVRQEGQERQVRLVGPGAGEAAATPWVALPGDAASLEVQWQKTAADESRLDLWIDGCGPDEEVCGSGWEVGGVEPEGLVTAVRLGVLEAAAGLSGEVRFDDIACAGDSWVGPE